MKLPRKPPLIPPGPFAEAPAWRTIGAGWRQMFGNFNQLGFSFEWHEFQSAHDLDWARSFHPNSVEVCLNLDGEATISDGKEKIDLPSRSLIFYYQADTIPGLEAIRLADQKHRFITVEFSRDFLQQHFASQKENLDPLIAEVVSNTSAAADSATPATLGRIAKPERLSTLHLQLVESLQQCPVFQPAREVWFRCKALELAALLFFRPAGGELFCTRTQRAARERVERARLILRENLEEPPTLEQLGKQVGCSSFYLSRLFSQESGITIQQYIRQIRMERAAELLRTGQCNVTEAALAVGYNSLSHFSSAFHQTFGCCPGLYPLKTPTQNRN
jgi:AraC-like DNA-binding protein